MVLDRIRHLKQAGDWAEIRRNGAQWLTEAGPDEKAWVLLSLAKAWEVTATAAADYRQAQVYAQQARKAAEPGSLVHTSALHRLAVYHTDFGEWEKARRAAKQFRKALPQHPEAEAVAPWVYAALGRYHHYRKKPAVAAGWFEKALQSPISGEFRERVQALWIWSLAYCNRMEKARDALPPRFTYLPECYHLAILAILFARCEAWIDAREYAQVALKAGRGQWKPWDQMAWARVEVGELYLILKQEAQSRRMIHPEALKEAAYWHEQAKRFLAGWGQEERAMYRLDSALMIYFEHGKGRKKQETAFAMPDELDDWLDDWLDGEDD